MLAILKKCETLIIQVLMVMMTIVLVLCTIDVGWYIIKDIIKPPIALLDVNNLLEIFGLFMLVVIGIELLETIMKAYLTRGQPHYEVVLSVAIIAVARKVIILDINQTSGITLVGIASVIIALTLGYFLMKRAYREPAKD